MYRLDATAGSFILTAQSANFARQNCFTHQDPLSDDFLKTISFSPDGGRLVAVTNSNRALVWFLSNNKRPRHAPFELLIDSTTVCASRIFFLSQCTATAISNSFLMCLGNGSARHVVCRRLPFAIQPAVRALYYVSFGRAMEAWRRVVFHIGRRRLSCLCASKLAVRFLSIRQTRKGHCCRSCVLRWQGRGIAQSERADKTFQPGCQNRRRLAQRLRGACGLEKKACSTGSRLQRLSQIPVSRWKAIPLCC